MADTHAVLWYLFGDVRLSTVARQFIEHAEQSQSQIAVSTISMAEVVYLVEKGRLPPAAYIGLTDCFVDPLHVFTEAALTLAIVDSMKQIPRASIPDMPDRIIAATAVYLDVPLISRDRRILSANQKTIW